MKRKIIETIRIKRYSSDLHQREAGRTYRYVDRLDLIFVMIQNGVIMISFVLSEFEIKHLQFILR